MNRVVGEGIVDSITGFFVSKNYPPKVRKWLELNKDAKIKSITIRRAPVKSAIETALNWITLGKWESAKKQVGYDKMFHLSLIVEYTRQGIGYKAVMEKLERINFTNSIDSPSGAEFMRIQAKPITIGQLVSNTQNAMGSNYFVYDAFKNNCQNFVGSMLSANGMLSAEAKSFVYQPVDKLLEKQPGFLHEAAKVITDVGAIANQIISGGHTHPLMY